MTDTDPSSGEPSTRSAFRAGALALLPLALGIVPFGLVYGVAVVETSIDDVLGGVASVLIVAGAGQLAMIDLIDEGAPWAVAVGTALVINARFAMYSAALSRSFSDHRRRWRVPMAYFMSDQLAVMALLNDETETDPRRRRAYWFGGGLVFVGAWIAATWIGVALGASLPEALQLGFGIPLTFLALMFPALRDRPAVVAAAVGVVVTVVARDAPYSTGLLIGATSGIVAGSVARR